MNSAILDLVVGMIFVFLVFSLVVSGLNEVIARLFEWRSRHLWRTLRQMLDGEGVTLAEDQRPRMPVPMGQRMKLAALMSEDPAAERSWTDRLYVHPLVLQLEGRLPTARSRLSHIPSSDFARALVDLFVPSHEGAPSVDQVRSQVSALADDSPMKAPLLAIAREAEGRLERLRTGIEEWFDARMSALSERYRSHAKWMLVGVGIVVAVAFNVDAVGAAQRLYRDEALRAAVAQQATSVVAGCEGSEDVVTCTREQVAQVDSAIRLPVGWPDPDGVSFGQVLGWLIAGVALGQGAPFWFDLLRRAGKLRQ